MFERGSERVIRRWRQVVVTAWVLGVVLAGSAAGAEPRDGGGGRAGPLAGGIGLSLASPEREGSEDRRSADGFVEELGEGGRPAYRRRGSQAMTLTGGYAHNFQDATDGRLGVAWSRFLEDDVEFMVEGGAWYYNQDDDNALGLSTSLLFRYHALSYENWSVFGELGIGVMGSTDHVPAGGTSFNFLPRAGFGYTHRVNDRAHLIVGAHWHHISNARILGDTRNPGRDAPLLYAGFVFPF